MKGLWTVLNNVINKDFKNAAFQEYIIMIIKNNKFGDNCKCKIAITKSDFDCTNTYNNVLFIVTN